MQLHQNPKAAIFQPTLVKRRYGMLKGLALAFFLLALVMPLTVLANESEKATFDSTTKLQTILTSSHRSEANRLRAMTATQPRPSNFSVCAQI